MIYMAIHFILKEQKMLNILDILRKMDIIKNVKIF